nr:11-beta-hydroxysteroid dehydrogenase-like 3 [Quercus suber]
MLHIDFVSLKHVAYEYAKRGARLALVTRREDRLLVVANKARKLGSPEVIVSCADVSKVEECKRFVDEAVSHFGRLDYLVNNAGILQLRLFEDFSQLSDIASVMASKAALISFFETLRTEFGQDIGITIVNPGVIKSEMTQGHYLSEIQADWFPTETTEGCAKAILDSACNGDID